MPAAAIARRVPGHTRTRGVGPVVADFIAWAGRWLTGRPFVGRPTTAKFTHDGVELPYQRSAYNDT